MSSGIQSSLLGFQKIQDIIEHFCQFHSFKCQMLRDSEPCQRILRDYLRLIDISRCHPRFYLQDPKEVIDGQFCQCNNFNCPRHKSIPCGGELVCQKNLNSVYQGKAGTNASQPTNTCAMSVCKIEPLTCMLSFHTHRHCC